MDQGPFSGLNVTNTFAGNVGFNTSTNTPGISNFLVIQGYSAANPSVITPAVGEGAPLGADFNCSSGAQLSISNVILQIPDNGWGAAALTGCQLTLSGTITFVNKAPVTNGAAAAIYQKLNSFVTISGSTQITFSGLYNDVINGEGTGSIIFQPNTSGTVNNVNCAPGTQVITAFVNAELLSVVRFGPGWNWDSASGCGLTAKNVTAKPTPTGTQGYQVALASGGVLDNSSGFNLPGPCSASGVECVNDSLGTVLAPINSPNLGSCANGSLNSGATNYGGTISFSGPLTSSQMCVILFAPAGGSLNTPAFANPPMCTASIGASNSSGLTNNIAVLTATQTLTLTLAATIPPGYQIIYTCVAPSTG